MVSFMCHNLLTGEVPLHDTYCFYQYCPLEAPSHPPEVFRFQQLCVGQVVAHPADCTEGTNHNCVDIHWFDRVILNTLILLNSAAFTCLPEKVENFKLC